MDGSKNQNSETRSKDCWNEDRNHQTRNKQFKRSSPTAKEIQN